MPSQVCPMPLNGRMTKLTEADGTILSFAVTPEGMRYLKTEADLLKLKIITPQARPPRMPQPAQSFPILLINIGRIWKGGYRVCDARFAQ